MVIKKRQILIYVVASAGFLALPIFFSPDLTYISELIQIPPFQRNFISYVLLLGFFYLNYLYLLPKFYFEKKYWIYSGIALVCYAVVMLLPILLIPPNFNAEVQQMQNLSHDPHLFRPMPPRMHNGFMHALLESVFQFMAVLGFSLLLKLNSRWKQAEKDKLDTELSYLKAQINPHFLFNTLNSIYSLAIEKSDYTATAVVKLSGMMRYVLDRSTADFVSLEDEVRYISDYIELQKVRLGDTVNVEYSTTGNMIANRIAPLILIPFVENAFKHGVNPEENSVVQISIDCMDGNLTLIVKNNKVNLVEDDEKTGVGIDNTRKRLHLLYQKQHILNINDGEETFEVILKIKLH